MQEGFEAAAYLGTPLAAPLPSVAAASVRSGLSQQIFDNSLQFPDMSVSERNIVFRRQPPMLQGMNLTRVPTGGFPSTPASVIVGSGVDGVEYNTRMPTLFTQPSDTNRRMDIGPVGPLSGGNGGETVYRAAADAVTRQKRGAMTVRRAEQEAAIARKKQRKSLEKMMGPPAMPTPAQNQNQNQASAPASAPASASAPAPLSSTPARSSASATTAVLAELGHTNDTTVDVNDDDAADYDDSVLVCHKDPKTAMTDVFTVLCKNAGKLHNSTRHLITGKLTWKSYIQRFVTEQHWIVAGVALTVLFVLIIFVIVVVMAARQGLKKPTPTAA